MVIQISLQVCGHSFKTEKDSNKSLCPLVQLIGTSVVNQFTQCNKQYKQREKEIHQVPLRHRCCLSSMLSMYSSGLKESKFIRPDTVMVGNLMRSLRHLK